MEGNEFDSPSHAVLLALASESSLHSQSNPVNILIRPMLFDEDMEGQPDIDVDLDCRGGEGVV